MPLHEILLYAKLSWVLKRAESTFLLAGMDELKKFSKLFDQAILLETRISYHNSPLRGMATRRSRSDFYHTRQHFEVTPAPSK
jgi:hypothetical protein